MRQKANRSLSLEPCEERLLLAIDGPQLLAAIPATGIVINENTVLSLAPREILLRFNQPIDPATIGSSIQFVRSADDIWGNGNDVTITPGYVGIEDAPNEIIVRFAENLPDDLYRMTIVGAGTGGLKSVAGKAFLDGANLTRNFSLDLPPQVVAIVPQPVTRDANGKLTQSTNTIDVYFNVNDPLDAASAQNVNNYQLIRTAGTSNPDDDVKINPTSVTYSAATGKAVLTFNTVDLMTNGTYRLRIGNSEPLATQFSTLTPPAAGSSFGTASSLGNPFANALGTQTVSFTDTINSVPVPGVIWPGSPIEPGERPLYSQSHVNGSSNTGAIPQIAYNFQSIFGMLDGAPQFNHISNNEVQKQRIREVFEYYAYYLGVQFVETASSGWTIAVGNPAVLGVPQNVGGVAGGSLAIMNSGVDWGASETRGSFFNTAMHEIGHLLGLGHNYEAPTVQGGGVQDGVFPNDLDILYGRYLLPALGNDINVYQFNLAAAGTLNVETIAERLQSLGLDANASRLDSVITLFDVTGKVIARNDDYFGKDSFLQLTLPAGSYYVAITSTGNTEFDPRVTNSGAGGTTMGGYQLRMTFTPTPGANVGIRDTSGNLLDGDNDGIAGGVNNFWFNVANTIHVDKVATGGTGALGSLSNPYTRISDALAAAPQGSIVRIAGNGGADGNLATVGDNLSYNIGFDNQNIPLSDGTRFDIPRGVTVMIDAGAIVKLRGANVNAGSFDVNINRSTGALQVLGTTARNIAGGDIGSVYFTSYYNRDIGTDPGINTLGLAKGNWGGIVFRDDSDLESNGIFLNYVNQARISYGGGTVSVSGTPNAYRPIHMETARPTITFNTITNSADAALVATPNSFEESTYMGLNFHADYSRVGPKVYGNTLLQNSINGLFILVRTNPNSPLDELTVNARIANTDIVHVLTETLLINGNPGGNIISGNTLSRPSARLAIDPGIIFKLGGGRFETEVGAQLIAEGTTNRPIIFTSIYDDRYGASGTSDTTNNSLVTLPNPGNWGGFIFGPTSIGSIDHALIAFAGGETRFEGFLDNIQPIEIHQAKVRIANSTFDWNRLANAGPRNGRGAAEASVIYVRGAQPVILNNIIQNNFGGPAININLNSLNSTLLDDWGRTRGLIGLAGSFPKNTGPLIRNNLIGNNSLNGMVVRGGQLTTNGVWDDTDIVHIVFNTISVPNQQSLTGTLRLQSSPTESLVVKMLGTNVDIIAGGELLDINDRTGGTLQIVGAPGHPVVITSLKDDSVGAGLTPQGIPQKDTRNTKGVVAPELPILSNSGPVILDTTARDVHGSTFTFIDGWDTLARQVAYIHNNSLVADSEGVKPNQILVIGFEEEPAGSELGIPYGADAINWAAGQAGVTPVFAVSQPGGIPAEMTRLNQYSMVYVMSHSAYELPFNRASPDFDNRKWFGGATDFMLDTLHTNKDLLFDYILNQGGGLLVMAQDSAEFPYRFAVPNADNDPNTPDPAPLILRKGGGNPQAATELAPAGFADVNLTDTLLNYGGPYRSVFEGSTNFNRLQPWSVDPITGEVIMLGQVAGSTGVGGSRDVLSPGDWGSIRLDSLSNDRNVELVLETEQGFTATGDTNQTPTNSQFLGYLAKDQFSGDDNVRLGFEIHGTLSQATDSPGGADVDVYSFRGTGGTTVWLDIDRTSISLDSVVELVDANGAVIARSTNSINESAGQPLTGSGQTLQIGTADSSPYSQPDFYTTNPKDAGMRVVLPGVAGSVGTYFVRVRSNSNSPNLTNLTAGITKGSYVLQIRLQEKDEFPGSVVRHADVRYANNGIEVIGKPEQSTLISNTALTGLGNGSFFNAQDLGNLLESGSSTIDVAANLANANSVHWYKFSLNYEQIQSITGLNDGLRTFAAMLQVNYADGLGRPDTTMSLYDESGTLLYIARDGQIADSLPRPNFGGIGNDPGNLKHGSFGSLDPTLGPVHLPAGAPKLYDSDGNLIESSVVNYYVAISSNGTLPEALTASFSANSSNPLIRLEPVDSITRIIDDRVGFSGGGLTTAGPAGSLFPVSSISNAAHELNQYADDYHLGDVVMFVNRQGLNPNETAFRNLRTVNPFTGSQMTDGGLSLPETGAQGYYSMAMRNDGRLFALTQGNTAAQSGNYVQINTATGEIIGAQNQDDGLVTSRITGGSGTEEDPWEFAASNFALQYVAMAFWQSDDSTDRRLFAIAERHADDVFPGDVATRNMLFELNPDTGEVLHKVTGTDVWNPIGPFPSATDAIPLGILETGIDNSDGNIDGNIVGMTIIGNRMFTITANGTLFEVEGFLISRNPNTDIDNQTVTRANFVVDALNPLTGGVQLPIGGLTLTGMSAGPPNVEGGQYKNTLFAISTGGVLHAFDTNGDTRGVFLDGAWTKATGVSNSQGLAFSSLDYNLWHATTNRGTDPGHGIAPVGNRNEARTPEETDIDLLVGGGSFYFGLSPEPAPNVPDVTQPGAAAYASNPDVLNTYALPGGAYGTLTSRTFDLAGYSALDKPTLYFNYLLDTPDVNSNQSAIDAFRVFASIDGVTWELLATNNVVPGNAGSETPLRTTPSGGAYKNNEDSRQKVQALYDSTTLPDAPDEVVWRQARVDLGDYAGKSDIRLRFQFTTAGTMASGQLNVGTGNVIAALPGSQLNNNDSFEIGGETFVFRKDNPPTPAANEILIANGDSAAVVARAMAAALDSVFIAAAGNDDDPDIFTVAKVINEELRIFGRTINSGGPLKFSNAQVTGDNHGRFDLRTRDRSLGNDPDQPRYEGVYIDDFVVGFASRGEMVTGAQSLDENFSATSFASVPLAVGDDSQILTGNYQLQIRPAQIFGVVDDEGDLRLLQSYDVNDRFAQGITIVARAAGLIVDGQTFNIDDGDQVLKFEFNLTGGQTVANSILINLSPSESADSVAIKIRDAINMAVETRGFKVRASTNPGGARVDLFDALSVQANSALGSGLQSVLVFNSVGDTRPQQGLSAPGQTLIHNNIVNHSRQVGILVMPAIGQVRDSFSAIRLPGQFPVGVPGRTGSIANLSTQNNKGWVPGISIRNNLVTHSGRTGIVVGGDPNASYAYAQGLNELGWLSLSHSSNGRRDVELFLPFVRVLNNTVYDAKVGIAAVNVASATIMNNILANIRVNTNSVVTFRGTGIYVDPSSGARQSDNQSIKFGETVVTANLYQNNSVDMRGFGATGETLAISLAVGAPLFVDASKDNFYLVPLSEAIDSSVDSLLDRPALANVVAPLGFAPSPILAPEYDLLGQTRIDDPAVDSPPGVGGNVFKDRGALERADFIGPTAALLNPIDNDSTGADRNALPNQVQLVNALLTDFAIQLLDGGSGIDNATIDISKFVITRTIGGVTETLVPNFDFGLAYDTNSRIVRLVPAQGLWVNGTYTITLDRSLDGIKDMAGNILQENAPPQTRFIIDLTDTVVSGWQNPTNRFDVNDDGLVTGQDLLMLINRILLGQSGPLPIVATAPPYLDVNGDGALRTSDVLGVVNEILRRRAEPLAAQPLAVEEPSVENTNSVVPEAAPLFETNVIVAGLTMNESPAAAEPQVARETIVEAEDAASPHAVGAAILADYPGIEASEGFDAWDDEMDGVLTELTVDLEKQVYV